MICRHDLLAQVMIVKQCAFVNKNEFLKKKKTLLPKVTVINVKLHSIRSVSDYIYKWSRTTATEMNGNDSSRYYRPPWWQQGF